MKRFILFLAVSCGISLHISAQVYTRFFEGKEAFETVPVLKQAGLIKADAVTKQMPPINVMQLLEEDRQNEGMDVPFRFGYGFDVEYTTDDANWVVSGSSRIWKMHFQSPGAYSLNFIFSELTLSPDAELYVFNPEGTVVYGPVTAIQNIRQGVFLTDLVAGDEAILLIVEPAGSKEKSKLTVSRVVHGYINMFPGLNRELVTADPLPCHLDVTCYPAWKNASVGVALVLRANGSSFCSGCLLNNTVQDGKPYFLSAFHCADADSNGVLSPSEKIATESWMFRFKYKSLTCDGIGSLYVTYNQATFRSAWYDTDFLLLEILHSSSTAFPYIAFLGWDKTTSTSTGTGIHHPRGALMKIAFGQNYANYPSEIHWSGGLNSPPNTHWKVTYYNGLVEPGSSGSPLFNSSQRVVGQAHGNTSPSCFSTQNAYYGRFDVSWTGNNTNDTRLSNWLNPTGSSTNTTNLGYFRSPPFMTSIVGDFNSVTNCPHQYAAYHNDTYPAPTSYRWMLSPDYSNNVITDATSRVCTITFGTPGEYILEARGINAYGESLTYHELTMVLDSLSLSPQLPYPNPVFDRLTVPLGQAVTSSTATRQGVADISAVRPTYDVRLYNEFGHIVKQGVSVADKIEFEVTDLPDGIYYLHVYTSGNARPEIHKVFVRH
ncbi:MAG: trypsin-like peptidase domain-containing protein [Tannerella sp.]|jgi:hypothetical protein|nr:trypsin-like peptidase domain-containing protein [Tannerella sp.]